MNVIFIDAIAYFPIRLTEESVTSCFKECGYYSSYILENTTVSFHIVWVSHFEHNLMCKVQPVFVSFWVCDFSVVHPLYIFLLIKFVTD